MVVAINAPRTRTSAGASEVAATTIMRSRSSAGKVRATKSSTSRPRSPISAMTFTSARVLRAIIESSVLLPTPAPAIIATRWPLPKVTKPLIARMPISSGSLNLLAIERIRIGDINGIGMRRDDALAVDWPS